jgi:hypothetical protein
MVQLCYSEEQFLGNNCYMAFEMIIKVIPIFKKL